MESNELQFLKIVLNPKHTGTLTTKEYLFLYGYIDLDTLKSDTEITSISQLSKPPEFEEDFLLKPEREKQLEEYKIEQKNKDTFNDIFGL